VCLGLFSFKGFKTMDIQVITKVLKAVFPLLALFGIDISPENSQKIIEGCAVLYAILSAIEAKIKSGAKTDANKPAGN
jgi:hypothetical protein